MFANGFCLLLLLGMGAAAFGLPILVIYLIIKWIRNLGKPPVEYGKYPAQNLTGDNLKARFMEEARRNAAAASVALKAKAGPVEVKSEQPADAAGRRKIISQGEGLRNAAVNKVALVQYIKDAVKAGQDEALITSTLIAKGWPEGEVSDAFSFFQSLRA